MSFRGSLHRSVNIMGRWVPAPVVWAIGLTLAGSILGALWPGLRGAASLVPERVWAGELWRLFSWVLVEVDPLSLLFAGFIVYWVGSDLCRTWGGGRFVATYLAIAASSGALTCVIARFLWGGALMQVPFYSSWPVQEALIIAWAMLFPNRRILFMLVLPVEGRALIYLTLGGTVLYAILSDPRSRPFFIPHFLAEGLMLAYMDRLRFLRRLWLRARLAAFERELRRRGSHLRAVDGGKGQDRSRWLH